MLICFVSVDAFGVNGVSWACISLKYLNVSDEEDPRDPNFTSKTRPQYGLLEKALPSADYKKSNAGIDISEYIPYNMLLFL